MFRKTMIRLLAAVMLLGCFTGTAAAAETDCDSVYCFSPGDFSGEETVTGICITGLGDALPGQLTLGQRQLRPGDILTAEQLAQMTFLPLRSREDAALQLRYLPIYETRVGPEAVMTLSIRGKEDKAPAAEDSALETYRNLPGTGKLKVSDPENSPLTYSITRQPKRGTVEIAADGSFTYTPKRNKVGVDSFVYTAADPAGNVSREATVTVTILKAKGEPYPDTQGRECRFAAEWMKNTGIFVGEQLDGQVCFQPGKTVTRGEFTAMMVKALELMEEQEADLTLYSDEIPRWLQPYVAAAVRSGLTAGLPWEQTFGAQMPITGAEAAVMLQNALDLTAGAIPAGEDVPAWAEYALAALADNGMLLAASEPLTRDEAAVLLYQAARRCAGQEFRILEP